MRRSFPGTEIEGGRVDAAWLEALFPSGGESSRTVFGRFADHRRRRAIPPFDDSPPPPVDEEAQLLGLRRALVGEWLSQGRRRAAQYVQERGLDIAKDGEDGIREGFRERLRYNDLVGTARVTEVGPLSFLDCHPTAYLPLKALALGISRPPSSNSIMPLSN